MTQNPNWYAVNAIPLDDTDDSQFTVECSDCGPLTIVEKDDVQDTCLDHLKTHGITVPDYINDQLDP